MLIPFKGPPSDIKKKLDDDNTRLTNHRQFAFPSLARLKPRVITF